MRTQVWGFSPNSGRDNLIESNHVHHVGNHDLSDLGGAGQCRCWPPADALLKNLPKRLRNKS